MSLENQGMATSRKASFVGVRGVDLILMRICRPDLKREETGSNLFFSMWEKVKAVRLVRK